MNFWIVSDFWALFGPILMQLNRHPALKHEIGGRERLTKYFPELKVRREGEEAAAATFLHG